MSLLQITVYTFRDMALLTFLILHSKLAEHRADIRRELFALGWPRYSLYALHAILHVATFDVVYF